MVEHRAVAFGRRAQPLEERREQHREIGVDLRVLRHLVGLLGVVRRVVVRLAHAEARIRALARLAPRHEREHAREIGLIRDRQQVEHHGHVLFERLRNADRRRERKLRRVARLGALDTPLDLAHVLEVVVEPPLVRRAHDTLQRTGLLDDGIENAAVLVQAPAAILGRPGTAEQPLERDARIDLHRQRRGLARPRDRVHVRAAVAGHAAADIAREILRRVLERRKRRLLADVLREHLVDRNADANVLGFRLLRDGARQPPRRAHGVIRDAGTAGARKLTDDGELIAKRLERLQDRRQRQRAGLALGHPVRDRAAVRNVHGAEAQRRPRRRLRERRHGRHHRFEERQRDGGCRAREAPFVSAAIDA